MSGAFWVYVNEPNDKAFVHLGTCPFCQNGKGLMRDKLDYNGRWLGPFSQDAAIAAARRAGKRNTRWCAYCARSLGLRDAKIGARA